MADETRPSTGGSEHSGGGERRPPRSGPGGGREGGPGGRKYFRRKKVCKFCTEKIEAINYKDVRLLAQFVAESGKIVPRRLTGVCTPHQRRLRVTEPVIKFLSVRIDEEQKRLDKIKAIRDSRKKASAAPAPPAEPAAETPAVTA